MSQREFFIFFVVFCCCLGLLGFNRVYAQDNQAPRMGRLFFTPQERAELDFRRETGEQATPEQEKTKEPPPLPEQININGLVVRKNGDNLVWINGSQAAHPGLHPDLRDIRGVNIPIVILNTDQRLYLKPGQRVTTQDGKVVEGYNALDSAQRSN